MNQFKEVKKLIRQTGTKVFIYFGVREAGEEFDPEEMNYDYVNLNATCIKGWVSQISPEKLVWKQYGLVNTGSVELLCDAKYKDWFKYCNKIVINDVEYSVFKSAEGSRVLIYDRAGDLIRVILQKKG